MDDQRVDRERGDAVDQVRFSLKKLFVCFTLVAVGLGVEIWFFRSAILGLNLPRFIPVSIRDAWPLMFMASGPMIGVGVFSLFRRPILGFAIGFVIQGGLYVVFLAILFKDG